MKRVRVAWNRSKSPKVKFYRVYRSDKMNIENQLLNELLVARVEHPTAITPTQIIDEPLIRVNNNEYRLEHDSILLEHNGLEYDFKLTVGGQPFNAPFTLDVIDGVVSFENEILGDVEILASYTYDGVTIWDYAVDEPHKEYYGPEAKDTSNPTTPADLTLSPEYENNRIRLSWEDAEPEGKVFYYRIQAFEDERTYSKLSEYRSIRVLEGLADRPYIVEKSNDGAVWREAAKVQYKEYFDFLLDRTPPDPVRNLMALVTKRTIDTQVDVRLNWSVLSIISMTKTPMYRVRATNRIGYTSAPSLPVGPIPFDTPVKHIIIRRKETNGTLPSFDGSDAITIATLDKDAITATDVAEGNKTYTYAVWVVDYGNNKSIAVTIDVTMPDNTVPIVPINLSATEFSHIVN